MQVLLREIAYDSRLALALVEEVQREYVARYGGPDESPVQAAEFSPPHGVFLVAEATDPGQGPPGLPARTPMGCGGLRRLAGDVAEIKRMYVRAPFRQQGHARRLLAGLEDQARTMGARRVVLETGVHQPEALALYPAAGYVPIPPFGHFSADPLSHFFGKDL